MKPWMQVLAGGTAGNLMAFAFNHHVGAAVFSQAVAVSVAGLVWLVHREVKRRDEAMKLVHTIHPSHVMSTQYEVLCPGPDRRYAQRCFNCGASQYTEYMDGAECGRNTSNLLPKPCQGAQA